MFLEQAAKNWSVMLHFSVPKACMDFSKIWYWWAYTTFLGQFQFVVPGLYTLKA
jgi:hypothetical protein